MPNPIHQWIAAHSSWFLTLVAALTLVALAQLVDLRKGTLRLSIDPSLDTISTLSEADRDYAELIRLRFGNREPVMVVLQSEDIYSLENLALLDRLSRALASLDGVESVSSLTATAIPHLEGGILKYSRLTEEALKDPDTPGLLRNASKNNSLLEGQLVSHDGRNTAILVHPQPWSEKALMQSRLTR